MSDAPKIRLHVDAVLAERFVLHLAASQAHYLHHVMRLKIGDELALFNGRDGEWRGRIDRIGKGACWVVVAAQLRQQETEPDLWLVFAPLKRARIDYLAEKATELGATALRPVITGLTAVRRVNTDRLRANAVEAAEQSGRMTVPDVFPPTDLAALLADWPADRRLLFCDERGGAPVADAMRGARGGGPWAVLAGPEGGFTAAERGRLRDLPFVTAVGLGPRTLRAETAALAALSLWQAHLGDWRA